MISAPVLLCAYGIWAYFFSTPEERMLLTPVALSAAILFAMVEHFWRRDRHLPIVDIGVLCAFITLIYIAMPTIFYIKSGLHWSALSDPRLLQMNTTPADVADLLWFVTAYLAAFCAAYALLRGPAMPGPGVGVEVSIRHGLALLVLLAIGVIYQTGIESYFHINLNPSNQELQQNYGVSPLPLFLGQITHNMLGILRITMLGIIAFVFARRNWLLGLLLGTWLLVEGYLTVSNKGPRAYYTFLIMAVILCYHRLIRPIGPIFAAGIALAMLAGLVGYGYWRDVGNRVAETAEIWSAATEFQVLLANGLHVGWAQAHGLLAEVPWQIKFNEIVLLIPQQLLPFQKLDMESWYIREAGVNNHGQGLMFGVVAQSKLGFGLPEIIVRGAALGAVLAFIHRQCVKHAASLTALVIYLWLCASIYYTYRASTFYIATWAAYRVVPFVLLFWFFSRIFLQRTRSGIVTARTEI
jgi:hypothetical protein